MLFPRLQRADVDKALGAYPMLNGIEAVLRNLLSPHPPERGDGWQMLRDHRF